MYTVYLLENPSGKIYIGYTSSIERRLCEHNEDQAGNKWTKGKGPWHLIYTEEYTSKKDAIARERKLKSLKAGQRIKKILSIVPR